MNISHLIKGIKLTNSHTEKLLTFGFHQENDSYLLKKSLLQGDFFVLFSLKQDNFFAEVYESSTNEIYMPFDVVSAKGPFISQIRSEVSKIASEIKKFCFEEKGFKERYVSFIEEEFNCKGDFPWNDLAEYEVFRCPSGKWFALIMKIKYRQIKIPSEESVWVVNIKAISENIPDLIDNSSIFPAYHMNKKNWLTILLDSPTDFSKLSELTKISFNLVSSKK